MQEPAQPLLRMVLVGVLDMVEILPLGVVVVVVATTEEPLVLSVVVALVHLGLIPTM
jgi:hypothetical protein